MPADKKSGLVTFVVASLVLYVVSLVYVGLLHSNKFITSAWFGGKFVIVDALASIAKANVPMFCVAAYIMLAQVVATIIYKIVQIAVGRGFNNDNPRNVDDTFAVKRALAAHQNSTENIPIFGLAVLFAQSAKVSIDVQISLCLLFLMFRKLFLLAYYFNISLLRSFVFLCGFWCCILLFGNAIYGSAFDAGFVKYVQALFLGLKTGNFSKLATLHAEL